MKQLILNALKTKFVGVSEAILNRIAEKLANTVAAEDAVQGAVDAVTFRQVLENYGDSRATEAQQAAVAAYEKKHGLKDGAKVDDGDGVKKPNQRQGGAGKQGQEQTNEAPEWAKAMLETNKKLEERLARIEGEKTAASRKSAFQEVLKSAPEKIRQRYEKDFSRMKFESDEDFNAWVGEITPDIEALTADFGAKEGVVGKPKGSTGVEKDKGVNPILQARIKEKEAATQAPAIVGLQT